MLNVAHPVRLVPVRRDDPERVAVQPVRYADRPGLCGPAADRLQQRERPGRQPVPQLPAQDPVARPERDPEKTVFHGSTHADADLSAGGVKRQADPSPRPALYEKYGPGRPGQGCSRPIRGVDESSLTPGQIPGRMDGLDFYS